MKVKFLEKWTDASPDNHRVVGENQIVELSEADFNHLLNSGVRVEKVEDNKSKDAK